jgi:hypothetical protein
MFEADMEAAAGREEAEARRCGRRLVHGEAGLVRVQMRAAGDWGGGQGRWQRLWWRWH